MEKLYPPFISGTIPAFYGTTLVVPFSMNKTVGKNEITGFVVKVKTINGTLMETKFSDNIKNSNEVVFELEKKYNVGQYYKVQIAYARDKGHIVGYYSTVGVVKYTTKPSVTINNLNDYDINTHLYNYTGIYSQDSEGGDASEKLYSSRFVFYDKDGNILEESSEEILHDSSLNDTDTPTIASENYSLNRELPDGDIYYIQYIVTTSNGLVEKSKKYRIVQRESIASDYDFILTAENDFDNGTIHLSLECTNAEYILGSFVLCRGDEKNKYVWEEIKYLNFQNEKLDNWEFIDYTAEQGITYRYSIQQYNSSNLYSERTISNLVYSDFEDAFLYDGERQLNIRFNPKVNTYRSVILEGKTETIGSKYPFISRNGRVNYKELAISGLISYQMDENENFITKDELRLEKNLNEFRTETNSENLKIPIVKTDLVSENMAAERIFKNTVLDWLNDGRIKLFKSPAEGNYMVRLMNVALTPTDPLGRMLHTFNCSAYEICQPSLGNFQMYGIISDLAADKESSKYEQTYWKTAEVYNIINAAPESQEIIPIATGTFYSVYFTDFCPGSIVYVNGEEIMIGATSEYILKDEFPINSIEVNRNCLDADKFKEYGTYGEFGFPLITYSYKDKVVQGFTEIKDFTTKDVALRQFKGAYDNIFDEINDAITELNLCYYMRFAKKDIKNVYVKSLEDTVYYKDVDCKIEIPNEDLDLISVYQIRNQRQNYMDLQPQDIANSLDEKEKDIAAYTTTYLIPKGEEPIRVEAASPDELFEIIFTYKDGTESIINLNEIENYSLESIDSNLIGLKTSDGVITEMSYSVRVLNPIYNDLPAVKAAREAYLAQEVLIKENQNPTEKELNDLDTLYKNYLAALAQAKEDYDKEHGKVG